LAGGARKESDGGFGSFSLRKRFFPTGISGFGAPEHASESELVVFEADASVVE